MKASADWRMLIQKGALASFNILALPFTASKAAKIPSCPTFQWKIFSKFINLTSPTNFNPQQMIILWLLTRAASQLIGEIGIIES